MILSHRKSRSAVSLIPYLWHFGAWFIGIAGFGLAGVILTLISPVLALVLPKASRAMRIRRLIGFCFRTTLHWGEWTGVFKLDVKELEALRSERGLVLACNHPMLIDAVLLLGILPESTCIMKAVIWDSPFLGGGARLAGYIRNNSPGSMVKQSVAELQKGSNILIFPEGTRTLPGRHLNEFKSGFALIAKKSGAPIQIIFIEPSAAYLGKSWPLYRPPPFPLMVKVRMGPRVVIGATENTHDAVGRVEGLFARGLAAARGCRTKKC